MPLLKPRSIDQCLVQSGYSFEDGSPHQPCASSLATLSTFDAVLQFVVFTICSTNNRLIHATAGHADTLEYAWVVKMNLLL